MDIQPEMGIYVDGKAFEHVDTQLQDAVREAVAAKLPEGWKIHYVEFFDTGRQVGVCIGREADEALKLSERRRWASRACLSDPALVDILVARLSRAWSN